MELAERDLKQYDDVTQNIRKTDKVNFLDKVKQYSIPIISVALFLGILVISIFPTAMSIFDNYKEMEKLLVTKKSNQETLDKLTRLKERDAETISDLAIIDLIVPSEKTKIVGLQQFIEEKTREYKLELKNMVIGEQLEKISDTAQISSSSEELTLDENGNPVKKTEDSLRVAPTTAQIEGTFANIQRFFSDFYKVDDLYIITTMNLKSGGSIAPADITTSEAKWTLDITFSKYAFSEDFLTDESTFSQIPASSIPDDTVVNYLRDRYSK